MSTSWLTIDDTAKLLGVSTKTIRRMIQRGELTAHRFGKRVIRIHAQELVAAATPVVPAAREGERR